MYDNVDLFDLERFVKAQDTYDSYNIALKEIKDGWKLSHWMWYVFPQIHGLGHSSMSQKFSIKSLLEAKAYLRHDKLGDRLYEVMNALPVHGDAEEIFGKLDAMKLRSCLTLFDLVSPQEIFADFLENYFNKERCKRTLQIVASELSYYTGDDAFRRNGIQNEVPRAFLEGIDGSDKLTYNNCLGTLLDLFGRGETMRMLVSRHLWNKEDFSFYRVSSVKHRILSYMETFFQKIADSAKDDALFNEMKDLYGRYALAEDNQLLQIADAFDEFWNKYKNDMRVKPVIDSYIQESICKPIEQTPGRIYNSILRPEYTPDAINSLKPDEVFVFGSNLHGHHGGGAARAARNKFGAIWGQGVGLQGQSYAIPTMQGGVETIKPYVDQFVGFAKEHTELFFYVTRIGCGIAGFKDSDIAPLFKEAMGIANICLPESFIKANKTTVNLSKVKEMISYSNSDMVIHYGQVRTMVDILIGLNKVVPFSDSKDAINEVEKYIASQNQGHSSISAMAFHVIADTLHSPFAFVNGKLNDAKIKQVFNQSHFQHAWENALFRYRFAKIWKLICYFNEFRRYSSRDEILDDLNQVNFHDYFMMTDSAWGAGGSGVNGYPWHFFRQTISQMWNKFAPNGILNTELIEEYMFENHEISLRTIGLEATIQKDYMQDSCWSDVYFPKEIGTAPVYIERKIGKKRRYIKSCGEGKGPNQYPESLEMQYAKQLLINDNKYEIRGDYDSWGSFCPKYFVPNTDQTLPIFGLREKIVFDDEQQRQLFVENELNKLHTANEHEIEEMKRYKTYR